MHVLKEEAELVDILSRHTHRMHGGTEYYSHQGIFDAMREVDPLLSVDDVRHLLRKVRDPKTFDIGEFYGKAEILAAMALADKAFTE